MTHCYILLYFGVQIYHFFKDRPSSCDFIIQKSRKDVKQALKQQKSFILKQSKVKLFKIKT